MSLSPGARRGCQSDIVPQWISVPDSWAGHSATGQLISATVTASHAQDGEAGRRAWRGGLLATFTRASEEGRCWGDLGTGQTREGGPSLSRAPGRESLGEWDESG